MEFKLPGTGGMIALKTSLRIAIQRVRKSLSMCSSCILAPTLDANVPSVSLEMSSDKNADTCKGVQGMSKVHVTT